MNNNISNDNGSSCIVVDLASVAFGASIACVAIFAPAYWPLLFFWIIPLAMKEAGRQKERSKKLDSEWTRLFDKRTGWLNVKDDKREDD